MALRHYDDITTILETDMPSNVAADHFKLGLLTDLSALGDFEMTFPRHVSRCAGRQAAPSSVMLFGMYYNSR